MTVRYIFLKWSLFLKDSEFKNQIDEQQRDMAMQQNMCCRVSPSPSCLLLNFQFLPNA